MSNPIRFAAAGAAILAIVLVALALRPPADVGPAPSVTAVPTPVPTPVSFSSAISGAGIPGSLVLNAPFPLRVVFDVPAGWSATEETAGRASLHKVRGAGAPVWIDFFIVDNAYADPCHLTDGPMSPPLGPSVDDFVTVVTAAPGFEVAALTDVTLDGRAGKSLDLSNQIDTAACDGDPFLQQWTHAGGGDDGGTFGTQSGTNEHLWVLDVDATRLVVLVSEAGEPTETELNEAIAIVNSIRFE